MSDSDISKSIGTAWDSLPGSALGCGDCGEEGPSSGLGGPAGSLRGLGPHVGKENMPCVEAGEGCWGSVLHAGVDEAEKGCELRVPG